MSLLLWGMSCAGGTFAFSVYLVRRYARPEIHWSAQATVAFSWFMTFSVMYLIPIDLNADAQKTMDVVWALEFWMVQLFTWIWVGLQQEYFDAGDFTVKGKIKTSIKENLKLYAVLGFLFCAFLIYIAISQHMDKEDLVAFVVALANTFGLSLLIICLGYGLVELPRNFWYQGNAIIRMKHYLYKMVQVHTDLDEAREDLVQVLQMVIIASRRIDSEHPLKMYLDMVEANCPDDKEKRFFEISMIGRSAADNDHSLADDLRNKDITLELLAQLNFKVKRAVSEMRRVAHQWEHLVTKTLKVEERAVELERNPAPEFKDAKVRYILWHLQNSRKMLLYKLLGAVCALFSASVIWCEMTMFSSRSLSIFQIMLDGVQNDAVAVQLVTMLPLAYISVCAFFALFRLRVTKLYHVHDGQQTDLNSLMFNAALMLRLVVGIGYNYMIILRVQSSAFLDIMGPIDVVPLFGKNFVVYFSTLIVVFCTATAFNLWGYFLKSLGVKRFEFSERYTDDVLAEGKQLLESARRKRQDMAAVMPASIKPRPGMLQATRDLILSVTGVTNKAKNSQSESSDTTRSSKYNFSYSDAHTEGTNEDPSHSRYTRSVQLHTTSRLAQNHDADDDDDPVDHVQPERVMQNRQKGGYFNFE